MAESIKRTERLQRKTRSVVYCCFVDFASSFSLDISNEWRNVDERKSTIGFLFAYLLFAQKLKQLEQTTHPIGNSIAEDFISPDQTYLPVATKHTKRCVRQFLHPCIFDEAVQTFSNGFLIPSFPRVQSAVFAPLIIAMSFIAFLWAACPLCLPSA